MGTSMYEVARLLRLAARCRYLACVTQSRERQAELIEMAEAWEHLAEQRRLEVITTSTLPGAERVARRTSLRKDVATARRSSEPTGTAGLRHGL